jgi:hypothetical protein
MYRAVESAWKKTALRGQPCITDPGSDSIPRRLGNLELHGTLGFLLQHYCPGCHAASVADVSDAQSDQVTGSKLAVDGEVEQRQLAATVGELQAHPDRPDLFELERRLLAYKLSLVPGFANGRRALNLFHDWLLG